MHLLSAKFAFNDIEYSFIIVYDQKKSFAAISGRSSLDLQYIMINSNNM